MATAAATAVPPQAYERRKSRIDPELPRSVHHVVQGEPDAVQKMKAWAEQNIPGAFVESIASHKITTKASVAVIYTAEKGSPFFDGIPQKALTENGIEHDIVTMKSIGGPGDSSLGDSVGGSHASAGPVPGIAE